MKLQGKVAVVTGASSGMGREIALLYAKEGAKVLAVARRADRLADLVAEAKGEAGEIVAFAADMANTTKVESMIDEAIKVFGKLDILVNNAGIMDNMAGIGDASDDLYDKVFTVNVKAPFVAMRKAVKYFEQTGAGIIVNVASVGGLYGHIAGAIYTASKHAIIGLTKNTGYTYAPKNIRCNVICPGGVETEISTTDSMKNINQEGYMRYAPGFAMNPRTGKGSEIASIALFLASEDSTFVNGAVIVADAGWTA